MKKKQQVDAEIILGRNIKIVPTAWRLGYSKLGQSPKVNLRIVVSPNQQHKSSEVYTAYTTSYN